MQVRRFAVIVGINRVPEAFSVPDLRYAEDDARSLHELLTASGRGTFPRTDARLLLGGEATTDSLTQALNETVARSQPTDTLLVFFAGHAWLPSEGSSDAYLVTTDLEPDKLRSDPRCGLRMRDLRLDIFDRFHGSSLLILDCCHAGRYDASPGGVRHDVLAAALSGHEPRLPRHTALMACPADGTTRESDGLKHGTLTHHLLTGLRGEAAGPDGCVTSTNIVAYVRSLRLQPDPGVFTREWGSPIVLTTSEPRSEVDVANAVSRPRLGFMGAENPLEAALPIVTALLDETFAGGPGRDTDTRLERIRRFAGAEGVLVGEFGSAGVEITDGAAPVDVDGWRGLLGQIEPQLRSSRRESLAYVAMENAGNQALVVPVRYRSDGRVECVVALNPTDRALEIGEPVGAMLAGIWHADPRDTPLQQVEAITALRSNFGRVPLELYLRCLSLYRQLLHSAVMAFQPVVRLYHDSRVVQVHSYEALARRNAESTVAPARALDIAPVWGDQFLIERDGILADKAVHAYAEAHRRIATPDAPKPVSINVSVRALLSDAYERTLRRATHEAGLDPMSITLEISERDPITPARHEQWDPDSFTYFAQRLRHLTVALDGVGFALDDFGVGYANLDRLSALPLTQIKIDRSILHHQRELALHELELVVRVARQALHQGGTRERPVIVEGMDEQVQVSLEDVFNKGIRYVQGFITELRASVELHPPADDDFKERIAALVRGERPSGPPPARQPADPVVPQPRP